MEPCVPETTGWDVWVLVELREMGDLATGGEWPDVAFEAQVLGVFRALSLAQAAVVARAPVTSEDDWDSPDVIGGDVPMWVMVLDNGTHYEITQMPVQDV